MHWNYLVLTLCLLLALFSIVLEVRRISKKRLRLRIASSVIAIACACALVLPVKYRSGKRILNDEAILLTAGFKRDSLKQFKNDSAYTLDTMISERYAKVKLISPDQLTALRPAVFRINIIGYGLTGSELGQLGGLPVSFHPSPYPAGITSVNWTGKIKQGQRFVLQGTFNNTAGKQQKLLLKALNTVEDSVIIAPQTNKQFELTDLPRSSGRMTDQLLVISGNDTTATEQLPVEVMPVLPLKILVLSGSPNFENKFLKNWLADHNFGVAERSGISKNKYSTQYVNLEHLPLTRLSAATLDKFDALIADLSVLRSLSGSEEALIKDKVTQNALGLIIRADTLFKSAAWFQSGFNISKATGEEKKSHLNIQGEKSTTAVFNSEQLSLGTGEGIQALVTDGRNRPQAAVNIFGTGKIVFTTITDTYGWMLAGDKKDYSSFWSLLIGKAAKAAPQVESWSAKNKFPSVNTPVTLQVETAVLPGNITMGSASASPGESSMLPFQWQSAWWPVRPGWQPVKHLAGPENWIYIYNPNNWAGVKNMDKIAATKAFASGKILTGVTKQIQQNTSIPVPKVYFYMLLLFCCTFLWLEGKLLSR